MGPVLQLERRDRPLAAEENFDRLELQRQRQPPFDHPGVMLVPGQLSDRAVAPPHAQNRIGNDRLALTHHHADPAPRNAVARVRLIVEQQAVGEVASVLAPVAPLEVFDVAVHRAVLPRGDGFPPIGQHNHKVDRIGAVFHEGRLEGRVHH